jgi:hypothetical protein
MEQVERPAVGVSLTQRLSVCMRAANPWAVDSLMATAFPVAVLVSHLGDRDSGVEYHGANLVSVLLTTVSGCGGQSCSAG